ncbi:MAG: outer membrane lipoprotein-sorting protein [Solimonas sp.]
MRTGTVAAPIAAWRIAVLLLAALAAMPVLAAGETGAAPGGSAATADGVLACMRANIPQTLTIKDIQITASDRNGSTRNLQGRLYASRDKDKLRAMVRISSPSDLAGAAYLLRERDGGDEMYTYLPALAKVRRVSGAAVDGSLWGTDLSYSDIKQIGNAFDGANAVLEKDEVASGRPARVLAIKPTSAESARFSLLRTWVDVQTCVALRVDFVDGSEVRKRLTVDPKDLQQSGTYWYATQALMSDLKEGSQTRLKVLGIAPNKELADRIFNPGTFYVGN